MTISKAYPSFDFYLMGEDLSEKTRKEYFSGLLGKSGLATIIGDLPVALISVSHITAWKLELRERGLSSEYRNNHILSVRRFFKWLADKEAGPGLNVLDHTMIKYDKLEKNKPHTTLTREEVDSLINHTKNLRDRALLKLYFGTGCRASEILQLDRWDWEGIKLVDQTEGVWEMEVMGKNKKYRPVCFFQDVKDAVDAYLITREDRYRPLFISMQNRRIHYTTVNQMIHDTARRAGLSKVVTPHVARHTFVTDRAAAGTPIPILAYQVGHAHGGITQRVYTHINKHQSHKAFSQFRPS